MHPMHTGAPAEAGERSRSSPFRASIALPIEQIVGFLLEALGRQLVQHIAGGSDPQAPSKWASGDRRPQQATELRLRTAYRVFQTINEAENEYAARGWFIGLNPLLDEVPPATAISEDRLRDVIAAAEAFVRTS